MNFKEMMAPVSRDSVLKMDGWHVWGGSPTKDADGLYYLLFSRWREELEHYAWISHSEIACAVSKDPFGPYEFKKTVLKGRGGDFWDGDSIHNPTVIKFEGKYYLYYMGDKGGEPFESIPAPEDRNWWTYRNNQRIGVAVADHPLGPWERFDEPVLDVSENSFDSLMTSNPSVTKGPDDKFYMVYKAVNHGETYKGDSVVCGVAVSYHPLGPFVKYKDPIMVNPENSWSVEDPYIWCQDNKFYALVKDFQGFFTQGESKTVALFESHDGIKWAVSDHPMAIEREIHWEDGEVEHVDFLERPQLLFEDGQPIGLFLASANGTRKEDTRNIHVPLKFGIKEDKSS